MAGKGQKKQPLRAIAAQALLQVIVRGQSLDKALQSAQRALDERPGSAQLQEICYGSLRWYYRLDVIISMLLNKPLKQRDQDIYCLLLCGLYQLAFMHTPAHAVLKETVEAAVALGKPWAKGLVNGVLRNYQREAVQLQQQWQQDDVAKYAHPAWIIERLQQDWPQHYQTILEANNQRPPMVLRVDLGQITRVDYLARLKGLDIEANALAQADSAIVLDQARSVFDLPGFERGLVSVQDAAAQQAAGLMQLQPGMHVLDACCAPGGKTLHMMQQVPEVHMLALDIDAQRLDQVRENLLRAGLDATLKAGDAGVPEQWWDGQPFDRILVDAPCSGSGVIRRHPDIKRLRQDSDINRLAQRQRQLLDALWPLLATGGMLVYSTCSVFKQENEVQLDAFLRRTRDATEWPIEAQWGLPCKVGRQILPGQGMDGFYYACLRKTT